MLKVAFLWHMHQPYYRDPATGDMFLPWVRLHCLKDYCDLPARVARYDRLKMTFNLVPSLVEQIDLYTKNQTSDRLLDLTRKPAASLDKAEKAEIFRTFFMANPHTMIEPYTRYRRLHRKLADCGMDAEMAARTTSVQEIRDLTVWANLVWIDPLFRTRPAIKRLFDKGEKFSEEDKAEMIDAEYAIMAETIPIYRSLQEEGKIEVSFTPYFHPILPLLCDTDSAREALPGITLPKNRFSFPEDAERQIRLAAEMYREKFGRDLTGVWPSEGSISEQTATILAKCGIKWAASDEGVLQGSMVKAGLPPDGASAHVPYCFQTPHGPIHLFFRDHTLSDKIGFVYSGWDEQKAVDDFLQHLHRLNDMLSATQPNAVVSIILDGENCWEYYRNDGDAFLSLLFERLAADPQIETLTMSEAMRMVPATSLKAIRAGSWINHNFRIWIGHPEDNSSWDLLWETRLAFARFKDAHPDFDPSRIDAAEKSLLVAEGSDWNWWYGDEHRGLQNEVFDQIYRAHLSAVYSALGLEIPKGLHLPISTGLPESYAFEPEGTATPIIDGRLTHYYEWLGAGKFDCLKAGGTMHRSGRIISLISYISDDTHVYLRIDFAAKRYLVDNRSALLKIQMLNPRPGEMLCSADGAVAVPEWMTGIHAVQCGIGDIAEIGIPKAAFFSSGRGEIYFKIGILENGEEVEIWPQGDPIRFQFSGQGEEIVWDL